MNHTIVAQLLSSLPRLAHFCYFACRLFRFLFVGTENKKVGLFSIYLYSCPRVRQSRNLDP